MSKELKRILDKCNSDKASKHSYHTVYGKEFETLRDQPINILEVGVWKGESVAAWLEYFPKATIYGIDIFERMNAEDIEVLNQERVHWLKADSTKPLLSKKVVDKWGDVNFDIIIDDGLHTPEANALTFKYLNKFMKDSGSYYIEDVWPLHKMSMKEMNHGWIKNRPFAYNDVKMDMFMKQISGYNYEEFDLRATSGEPDSYIFKINF